MQQAIEFAIRPSRAGESWRASFSVTATELTYAQSVRILEVVGFEWDEASKAGINYRKHGVRMPEAIPVFDDPYAITIADDESDPDERRLSRLGSVRSADCSWSCSRGAARTIASFPRVLPKPMSVSSTRQNDERPIRFQQRQAGQGYSGGT